MEELKTIKQVFKDYNSNSFALSEAKIACINLYKKTNTLELKMNVTSSILMKDLTDFEKYLEKRFGFRNIDIKIENNVEDDVDKKITLEWQDIVEYMAFKHPLTKALLKNSRVIIDGNKLLVKLAIKGKKILEARSFNKILAQKLQDLYHKNYIVEYQEEITKEMLKTYEEQAKELEKQAILLAQKEAQEHLIEVKEEAMQQKAAKKSASDIPPVGGNMPPEMIAPMPEPPPEEEKENTPLIYGRSLKIKEELSKVIDLSVDSGKVLLDGEILNTDERELKSGKFLVTFDLYDGSSTITCKAFVEADKKPEVMRKIKISKRCESKWYGTI